MTTELDAAVARLKQDVERWDEARRLGNATIEWRGEEKRLLLADWERLGRVAKNTASLVREADTAVGLAMNERNRANAERDAARAEVERLREENKVLSGEIAAGHHDPVLLARGYEEQIDRLREENDCVSANAFAATEAYSKLRNELARLRERDARVRHELLLAHGFLVQGSKFNALARVEKMLALLKETP